MNDKYTPTDSQMSMPLEKSAAISDGSMGKMSVNDVKDLNKADRTNPVQLPEVVLHDTIQSIKDSSGDDRAAKIKAEIGEQAASSVLAQRLFPELAPHTRGVAVTPEGHIDLTNPNDPDYVLPTGNKEFRQGIHDDLEQGKISGGDIVQMLQLAKDIGTDNKILLPSALACCGLDSFKGPSKTGSIIDRGINFVNKTDVQEMEKVSDAYKQLRKNVDHPDKPVKLFLGDAYPPPRNTTPAANLDTNIEVIDKFALPALKEMLK